MKITKGHIINVIKETENSFYENELTYLAMTSKVENPLRDKIAYLLHRKFSKDFLVCREWKNRSINNNRTDLAIIDLKTQKPKYLIEFKATSLQSFEELYATYFKNELEKMNNVAEPGTEMYYIFFQNLPGVRIDEKYNQAVKYFSFINNYFNKYQNETIKETREKIHEKWYSNLIDTRIHSKQNITKLTINAGYYYNLLLSIEIFLYGPIVKS